MSGYTLSRGMLFVGAGYYKDRSAWKPYDFLIDPTRSVSPTEPDTAGRTVSYWPAYSKLTPNARAALLAWLADGAQDPQVAIGYVMLYFYGLQHRLLENDPGAEAPALIAELQRLQALYGENAYFAQACATCLEAVAQQERGNPATTD